MYYIYVDEAGTSAKEPVTVVVGVIVHADRHWKLAESELVRTLDAQVPLHLRSGFIFHAKDIFNGYRDEKTWLREDRLALIAAVASIPRRLKMGISLAIVRREYPLKFQFTDKKKMNQEGFHHMLAFTQCMARADKFVRDVGGPTEVATVVAEDVQDKRQHLKNALRARIPDLPISTPFVSPTKIEHATGIITQTNPGKAERIVDTVHFAAKDEAPLLQISDACAFSFRRYFSAQQDGSTLVKAMLGIDLEYGDWKGPTSNASYRW